MRWTVQHDAWLRDLYPDTPNKTIAKIMGRSEAAVDNRAVKLGLVKSPEYLATKPGCFKPGLKPWNKGKPFNPGGRSAETRFKKGHNPHNWCPIGHERVSKDGILERKVTDTGVTKADFVPVHVLVWEAEHGPVPEGHIVIFKDGDRRNFDPSNLECISRAENMRRNTVHRLPKEVALTCQLLGALNRQINKRAGA
ncbi:HNH endonuclease signature motif containing protein [Marinobacter sp.]|uniref:HNH endonuclease signature motif containing protein n=1 Tax=Marinobacter sp. TaxID=50741 RepID=UPI0035C740ED